MLHLFLGSSLVTVCDSPTFATIKWLQNVVSKRHHFLFQIKNPIKIKISSDWSTAACLYVLMFVLVPGVEHGLTWDNEFHQVLLERCISSCTRAFRGNSSWRNLRRCSLWPWRSGTPEMDGGAAGQKIQTITKNISEELQYQVDQFYLRPKSQSCELPKKI